MSQNHHRHHSSLSEKFQKTKMILDFRNFIFSEDFQFEKNRKVTKFLKMLRFLLIAQIKFQTKFGHFQHFRKILIFSN